MDSALIIQMIVLFLLLVGSAFFSASETSLMSLSKIDARHMVDQQVKGAKLVAKLIDNPNKLLGSILVGNNLVNIGASALATSLAIQVWEDKGVGIATGIMTLLVLIFGEITPKSLSAQNSQKVAIFVSKPIALIVTLFGPIVKVLMLITNAIIRVFGGKIDTNKPFITEDELRTIVTVSHEEGVLEAEEKEMIYNVFGFGDSYTKDVMIPRTDMIVIPIDATLEEILAIYKEEQFSRIPVFEDTHDHIVGVLYIKDLLLRKLDTAHFSVSDYLRKPYFVHEYKRIDELFKELRLKKIGIAIVVDEYGGTSGLVTMEDLIEEIVGDIDDEYDVTEDKIIAISDMEYLIDGSCRISVFNQVLDLNINSNEFDSIGGFVIGILDRFPTKGEEVFFEGMTFIIEKISSNRIQKLKVLLPNENEVGTEEKE